jgi:hypothetical protein
MGMGMPETRYARSGDVQPDDQPETVSTIA